MKGIIVAALAMTLACQGATGVIGGRVVVRATPPDLQLVNVSRARVYFHAMEGGFAARANWAACSNPKTCTGIAPGKHFSLPYTHISGYKTGPQVVLVYWWHLIPEGEAAFRPDSIRVTAVEIQGQEKP